MQTQTVEEKRAEAWKWGGGVKILQPSSGILQSRRIVWRGGQAYIGLMSPPESPHPVGTNMSRRTPAGRVNFRSDSGIQYMKEMLFIYFCVCIYIYSVIMNSPLTQWLQTCTTFWIISVEYNWRNVVFMYSTGHYLPIMQWMETGFKMN